MIKVLHNNSCSKSRGILEYLDEHGVPFEVIDIIAARLSELEIRTVLRKMNTDVRTIIRKNEPYYTEQLAPKNLSDDELITELASHPELLQRPILIKGAVAMLGRPVENVAFFLDD